MNMEGTIEMLGIVSLILNRLCGMWEAAVWNIMLWDVGLVAFQIHESMVPRALKHGNPIASAGLCLVH